MSLRWVMTDLGDGHYHVTPTEDHFDHILSVACGCVPDMEFLGAAANYVAWLVSHREIDWTPTRKGDRINP